jgi:drug/metabolite transporter (DMT)-like permease
VEPFAAGLVLLAAVLHVGWNVLVKTSGDPLQTSTIAVVGAALILVPLAAFGVLIVGPPPVPAEAWLIGVVSGVVEVGYFILLSAAYRRGDLSLVYPLARGSAPLLAVVIGVAILGERLAPGAAFGVVLLLTGLLAVQQPWRLLRRTATTDHAAAAFALATGVAIATYSALDRLGAQLAPAWLYSAILWTTCAAGLLAWTSVGPGRDARITRAIGRHQLGRGLAAGAMTSLAYGLVLVALSRTPLAAVAPLRESAIVLAAAAGALGLREVSGRAAAVRLGGAGIILAGAVSLAFAR